MKKKAEGTILISDKIYFETKLQLETKKDLYIIIKGANQQENVIFVNIYSPNLAALKQIFMDIKREIQ